MVDSSPYMDHPGGSMMAVINGVPERFGVTFSQSARGFFYCDKVTVEASSETEMLSKMDFLLCEIKKRLNSLNGDMAIDK